MRIRARYAPFCCGERTGKVTISLSAARAPHSWNCVGIAPAPRPSIGLGQTFEGLGSTNGNHPCILLASHSSVAQDAIGTQQ